MPRNWDWLVSRIRSLARIPITSVLLTGLAVLALAATLWLLWPLPQISELKALVTPTVTLTPTQRVVQRQPTPTAFFPTATPAPLIHVVVEGEVLGLIAEEYDTTVEAILQANNLKDANMISIGQELVIVGAQRTPVLTAMVTPTPTATPTSVLPYPAPQLISPADEAVFQDREPQIFLQWTSVAILNADEWYEVRLWSGGEDDVAQRVWTRASSWTAPDSPYPGPKGGLFYWDVSVVRRSGQDVLLLSPRSETRRFGWH